MYLHNNIHFHLLMFVITLAALVRFGRWTTETLCESSPGIPSKTASASLTGRLYCAAFASEAKKADPDVAREREQCAMDCAPHSFVFERSWFGDACTCSTGGPLDARTAP